MEKQTKKILTKHIDVQSVSFGQETGQIIFVVPLSYVPEQLPCEGGPATLLMLILCLPNTTHISIRTELIRGDDSLL